MTKNILSFDAIEKDASSKGKSKALRRQGRIPAIIYGGKDPEVSISLDTAELTKEYLKGHFLSKLFDLNVGNKTVRVLPKEVQIHPVTDNPLHVDFMRVEEGARVNVFVQVKFINYDNSPGLKRGGVLNIVRRDVELDCDVSAIPEKLIVDLSGLNIGQTIHVSSISIPAGCEPTIKDRDFTIATIVGRMAKEEENVLETGEEGAEGIEGDEDSAEGDEEDNSEE